ncbi:MAG: General secretion pathway protein L [uncultured Ramlibacter sp.]|uniref:General secretion pathway protein L n=1 Tax=uncultured Ramlibacter sp. TaxID=260755 RepID=A0A6J4Q1H6_9BURK|nr:MAG: General secretion pathway protein L [uncultured Ramlibacter sp.]
MSSIYVLLPDSPATSQTEFEYLVSPDRRSVAAHASARAALLPHPKGAGSELVLVAPASMLSWHQVQLPKGTGPRSPRLRAVLEGLLEDRLLDDPEHLHFALEPKPSTTGAAWVAVCDRAWLRGGVQLLESAGRAVTRIVPEFAPEGEAVLYAVGEPEAARLVLAGSDGVFSLPLASSSLGLLPAHSPTAAVIAEPAVAALAEQVLQRQPRLQQPSARLLAAAQTRWDLAQLDFASSSRSRAMKKVSTGWAEVLRAPQWRPARLGAALLLLVQLVGLNAWAWKERTALAAKRDASRSILTQTFPQIRAVVDPPLQMEREVAALRQLTGSSSGRDLETMLGAVASVAPPGRTATGLEFTGTELRLRGLAASEADARPLVQGLRSRGYSASLQGEALTIRPGAQP